ncbi:ABC transporter ATP-binding protein [Roseixanthobacter liquoris]|uniref:ABC transporter ATP-binding protein n=1 Tax=Roseixanthobacter liquoris TaxID=3119921 RepID=UPI00372D5B35
MASETTALFPQPAGAEEPLLRVNRLRTSIATERGRMTVVNDVSFEVRAGRTLCIVGESGCGKSITSLSVMRLLPKPQGRIDAGNITLLGRDLTALTETQMHAVRGREVSIVFQEPMTALNPVYTIGDQIMEALLAHERCGRQEARSRVVAALREVGIPDPERRIDTYPHELSGGMRQRVVIAMALICRPKLLIADEPTTALDVTVQAQILELFRQLRDSHAMGLMLITHDLGVVAEMADDVMVMYAGRVVEAGPVASIFNNPQHPYTIGLLGSLPKITERQGRLSIIPGTVPNLMAPPSGCCFHPRCPLSTERCVSDAPPLAAVRGRHRSACWLAPLD